MSTDGLSEDLSKPEVRAGEALVGSLLRAQDEERRRLARALHDGIGQRIAVLGMNLSLLSRQGPGSSRGAELLAASQELIDASSLELRAICHQLYPPHLEELGLSSTLRWLADGYAACLQLPIELQLAADLERLPPPVELGLFRLAEEHAARAARTGSGAALSLRLGHAPGGVAVTLREVSGGARSETAEAPWAEVRLAGAHARIRALGGRVAHRTDGDAQILEAWIPVPAPSVAWRSEGT